MFTGIVEELGTIKRITRKGKLSSFEILAEKVLEGSNLGDSIAVNGVCLTLTAKPDMLAKYFCVDVIFESQNCTNLSSLKVGDLLHLERALNLNTRLGGHLVSGHVDYATSLLKIKPGHEQVEMTFKIDPRFRSYFYLKGSVALNGVSLTLSAVSKDTFSVSLIPHTLMKNSTTIGDWRVGNLINVECDQLVKTQVQAQAQAQQKTSLSFSKLRGMGY